MWHLQLQLQQQRKELAPVVSISRQRHCALCSDFGVHGLEQQRLQLQAQLQLQRAAAQQLAVERKRWHGRPLFLLRLCTWMRRIEFKLSACAKEVTRGQP
jgi:hypothetical protein